MSTFIRPLHAQRDVVKNEKRQREGQPYGQVFNVIAKHTYPPGHPYSWTPIGSVADLDAATLADVRAWHKKYYTPNNVVLTLSGDIDLATAKRLVTRYFGEIPAGPPLSRQQSWIAKRTGTTRYRMQDRVPQARIYQVWNIPGYGTPAVDYLDLAAGLLADGQNSLLYRQLVVKQQLATNVTAWVLDKALGGQFMIIASVKPGVKPQQLTQAINKLVKQFIQQGPEPQALQQKKMVTYAGVVRDLQKTAVKADVLSRGETLRHNPQVYRASLERIAQATAKDVQQAAKKWLTDGEFILTVVPFPQYSHSAAAAITKPPAIRAEPAFQLPQLERASLTNGLKVVLVQRHDIPTVDFNLQFNAGFATDKPGKLGLAAFTAAMLNKGTDRYSATQLQNRAETLGASLSTDTNLTTTRIQLSALKQNLPASLALYADYILHPAFKQPAIDQLKSLWLAGIKDEKAGSQSLAWRLLPKLLYGSGNPYAKPLSGNGTLAAIEGLKRSDLLDFQRTWLRPDNATLIVVGDTNLTQLLPQLEKVFAGWQAPATPLPRLQLTEQPLPDSSRVYLVNKPGAEQSAIFAAQLVPAQQAKEELAIKAANSIIGGSISARLSQNLREQKNWSYGVYSQYVNPKGQGFWLVDAPVQTDKTAPAIEQILQEYRAYVSNRPATASELARFKKSARSAVPASLETSSALLAQVSHIVAKNRLDNYLETYLQQVKDETLTEVRTAAVDTFKSRQLTWLIIGDLAKIEPGIKKLGLGPVTVLNAEGQPQSGK